MFDPSSLFNNPQIKTEELESALKNLPLADKIKALAIYRYYKEIKKIDQVKVKQTKEIQKKYLKLEDPIIKSQNRLISGDKSIQIQEVKNPQKFLTEEEIKEIPNHLAAKKIPSYWLKAMKNSDVLKDQIKKNDQEVLTYLHNIEIVDEEGTDNFEIIFSFNQNPFFKNKQLTKKFIIKDDYPTQSKGTVIQWESGKDVTKKQIKKKQKNKKTGQNRVITKVVDADSFFNFFGSITLAEGNDLEVDEKELKIRQRMDIDFELGGIIVDECVPYSLEYYLGVKAEGDQDQFDSENQQGAQDQDQQDQEPKKKSKSKGKKGAADKNVKAGEKPQCKQQ